MTPASAIEVAMCRVSCLVWSKDQSIHFPTQNWSVNSSKESLFENMFFLRNKTYLLLIRKTTHSAETKHIRPQCDSRAVMLRLDRIFFNFLYWSIFASQIIFSPIPNKASAVWCSLRFETTRFIRQMLERNSFTTWNSVAMKKIASKLFSHTRSPPLSRASLNQWLGIRLRDIARPQLANSLQCFHFTGKNSAICRNETSDTAFIYLS